MAETSRDVLRHIVMAMQTDLDVYQSLASVALGEERLLSAIAADDAELARLRRIEDAARAVDSCRLALGGEIPVAVSNAGELVDNFKGSLQVLSNALMLPTMRQLGEADAAAKEGKHG